MNAGVSVANASRNFSARTWHKAFSLSTKASFTMVSLNRKSDNTPFNFSVIRATIVFTRFTVNVFPL